jgi:hypothetical protein
MLLPVTKTALGCGFGILISIVIHGHFFGPALL